MIQEAGPKSIIYPFSLGGISSQPAHLRYENQVEDSMNAAFNVIDGMSKRPGSLWLATLDLLPVTFTNGNWTAATKTVTSTGSFSSYTWSEGDYVYIRLAGANIRWGYYEIESKTDSNNIVLTESIADDDQTAIVTSGWPTNINYRMHIIERDESEKYLVLYGNGQIRIFDDSAREQIVRITDASLNYLLDQLDADEGGLLVGVDADSTVLATVADHTLVCNKLVIPIADASEDYDFTEKSSVQAMFDDIGEYTNGDKFHAQVGGRGLPSGFYEYQAGASTFAKLYCRWCGPFWSKTATYNGVASSSFHITFYEPDGTKRDVRISGIDIVGATTMNVVATQFQNAVNTELQALTGGSETCSWTWEQRANRGRFIITSPWSGAGSKIRGIFPTGGGSNHWAIRFPFAKTQAKDGKGQSTGGQLTVAERFDRIIVPGQLGAVPDQDTMPMALIRYTISEIDDASQYFPGDWELDVLTWEGRKSGSALTNSAPALFQAADQGGTDNDGNPIADIAFHRDRLVFAAGEKILMSQSGDLFNFYVDDATNIVDSDPIELSLSTKAVTNIEYITPFHRSLLIFTKAGVQFELNSPEALTPSTGAITVTTSYQTHAVRPVGLGDLLYFGSSRGAASIIYEYAYDDVRVNNFAADITSHVADLLPPDIRSLVASTNTNQVFIVPLDCDQIYVYASWWNGNQKAQSAWVRWKFDASYRIIDIGVIGNDLFMLIETASTLFIEKIQITRQVL
jgi:hypothetical protein